MYSKDFSKIYNQNVEVTKVLHKNLLVWSSVFDGDFSNPNLWEMGGLNWKTGKPYDSSFEARTKNFYKVLDGFLSVTGNLDLAGFTGELYFYTENYSLISYVACYNNSTIITVPNNATYYRIMFYKGIGAQLEPMDIPVFVPEANIKVVPRAVYLAKDSDFVNVSGNWVYRGAESEVEIPTHINGQLVTSTSNMFDRSTTYNATSVTKVVLRHDNVTSMDNMFYSSNATTLDLTSFDTSNVTSMGDMFSFSSATILNLSSFNTSNVTNMSYMFYNSSATTLDLSSFNTSNVTSMDNMFYNSMATTGYARTQADADRFNASSNKPSGLTFVEKGVTVHFKDDFSDGERSSEWVLEKWGSASDNIIEEPFNGGWRFRKPLGSHSSISLSKELPHITEGKLIIEFDWQPYGDESSYQGAFVNLRGDVISRNVYYGRGSFENLILQFDAYSYNPPLIIGNLGVAGSESGIVPRDEKSHFRVEIDVDNDKIIVYNNEVLVANYDNDSYKEGMFLEFTYGGFSIGHSSFLDNVSIKIKEPTK